MLGELTVEELIFRVADAGDLADAGVAAAVVALLGTGLMEMSFAITERKRSDLPERERVREVLAGLRGESVRQAADRDWEMAEEANAASLLPTTTGEQQRLRSDARLTSAMRRGRTQLMLRNSILETLPYADAVVELSSSLVLPDAGAGVHLLRAALLAAHCGQVTAQQCLEATIEEIAAQPAQPEIALDVSSLRQCMTTALERDLERIDGVLQRFADRMASPEPPSATGSHANSAPSAAAAPEVTSEVPASDGRMWEWTLEELIARTASAEPTPSTGSTVPVVAALGVGLLLRAIDLRAPEALDSQEALDGLEVEAQLRLLLPEFSEDAEFDRDMVQRYLSALRGPRSTDEERAERKERLRESLVRGTRSLYKQVLSILHVLSRIGNAVTLIDAGGRSEALAAVHFLEGAVEALLPCIEANLGDLDRRLAGEEGYARQMQEWVPMFREEVRQAGEEARMRCALLRAALSAG